MFNKGDLVRIKVHNPMGTTCEVYGNIGIITDVNNSDGLLEYFVKDEYRHTFVYIEKELELVSVEDICRVCRELLEAR